MHSKRGTLTYWKPQWPSIQTIIHWKPSTNRKIFHINKHIGKSFSPNTTMTLCTSQKMQIVWLMPSEHCWWCACSFGFPVNNQDWPHTVAKHPGRLSCWPLLLKTLQSQQVYWWHSLGWRLTLYWWLTGHPMNGGRPFLSGAWFPGLL